VQTAIYNSKRRVDNNVAVAPVFASADSMFYSNPDRTIHYEGNVDIKQATDRMTGGVADVYLAKDSNEMEKTIAQRDVMLIQPNRRGTGDWVEYTAATEVAVLKGNPARVDDVEQGNTHCRRCAWTTLAWPRALHAQNQKTVSEPLSEQRVSALGPQASRLPTVEQDRVRENAEETPAVPEKRHPVSGVESALRTTSLVKHYGKRRVVDNVSLQVHKGEVVGLLGANGAGKTTTFYMIVGLERPDSGNVLLGEQDLTKLPMYLRARLGIGYLPQEPSVFRKMTAAQNILAVLETVGLRRREQLKRLEELLEEFGIGHVRNTRRCFVGRRTAPD
jgi:ABC-type multidrug transport system fused ATPase/permease subunit